MGGVGTAEGVAGVAVELIADGFQVIRRRHYIAVENQQKISGSPFSAVVSALSGSGVFLFEISQIEFVVVSVADFVAWNRASVFYDNHLEVGESLPCQALEQLFHLVGAVEYRNDN